MHLPKEITTVTPLSRRLALILFIVLPILGFLCGEKYQSMIDNTISNQTYNSFTSSQTSTPTQDVTNVHPSTSFGKDQSYKVIDSGDSFSAVNEQSTYVVQDKYKWRDIWNKTFSGSNPQPTVYPIDFNQTTLIAVFQGKKSSGGYYINIRKITDEGNKVIVTVDDISPANNCVVTDSFTAPYQVVTTAKITKPVEFSIEKQIRDCK